MARSAARRRRRVRRFTPRRWLPFLALSALVVGASVLGTDAPAVDPAKVDATLDRSLLPSLTPADAISTAWYCAGGTALGDDGRAELSVVLANDAPTGATAEVTLIDAEGAQASQQLDVPAYGRARLATSELVEADWVAAVVEVRGGRVAVDREVSGPLGFDAGPCSTEASDRWYVPSGSTVRGATEYLALFNPFPDTASVNVTFATETGARAPRALQSFSVPGGSLRMVDVTDTVTDRASVAATVRARAGRVVVDRVQIYDGTGDPVTGEGEAGITTPPPRGITSTAASPVRAPRWAFAAGRAGEGVRTQVAVYNPGGQVAEVDVVVGYQEPDLYPGIEPVQLSIRPGEQEVVDLTDLPDVLTGIDLWVDVQSLDGVPVVAERLSFFGDPSERTGAAAALGSPLAATEWLVTQGGATRLRTATVQVVNPGPADAEITVHVLADGDRTELSAASVTVPAGDRRALALTDAPPAASIVVSASQPVVVTSSLSLVSGVGIAVAPAFPYPEVADDLPPPG